MGEVIDLGSLRSACVLLVDWFDNPPAPDTADWAALEGSIRVLQLHTELRGPLGDSIREVVSGREDEEGSRLEQSLNVFRSVFRLGDAKPFSTAASN